MIWNTLHKAARTAATAAVLVGAVATNAEAVVLWDESIDGDALPADGSQFAGNVDALANSTNVGTAMPGDIIRGTFLGAGTPIDRADLFRVQSSDPFQIDLTVYTPGFGSSFAISTAQSGSTNIGLFSSESVSGPLSNVFGLVPAGDWVISFANAGATSPVSYEFTFASAPQNLPEPASFMLFGFGLAGLGLAVRRRRHKASSS